MGLLVEHKHKLEGEPEAFTELTMVLPRDVGAMWEALPLKAREVAYNQLIKNIRIWSLCPKCAGKGWQGMYYPHDKSFERVSCEHCDGTGNPAHMR